MVYACMSARLHTLEEMLLLCYSIEDILWGNEGIWLT
jgi:hypothetical protein